MSPISVIHAQNGNNHTICINSLRVIISNDGDMWEAQGIDIDYASCGSSIEDVQARFEKGFSRTIQMHLKKFGTIDKLLKMAPTSEWRHLVDAETFQVDVLTNHEISDMDGLPFKDIAYYQAKSAAA